MFINNSERRNNICYCFVLFMFSSLSTLAQVDQSSWEPGGEVFKNPEGAPNDPDPIAAPIDDHIMILLISGLTLGLLKIQQKKE